MSTELQESALKGIERKSTVRQENRAINLTSLAIGLVQRYFVTGQDEKETVLMESDDGIDRATSIYAEAVKLTPDDAPHLGNLLGNRGNAILAGYEKKSPLTTSRPSFRLSIAR